MRILTGIQPSGALHIGNYFGAIQQILKLQQSDHEVFAFIANYHAMTSIQDARLYQQNMLDAAVNFLALGLDPKKVIFWMQSDVSEVLQLYWILSNFSPMGLLERSVSYKDKIEKGINANHGLFSYPVLMAADILLYDSNLVPVGKDQIQHIEMARDIALRFNHHYKQELLTVPKAKISEELKTIIGTDGAKMSKSYNNTIDIFADEKILLKKIKAIPTESVALESIKDHKNCIIFNLAKLFLDETEQNQLIQRYQSGKEGHGHFKEYLFQIIWEYFRPYREKRQYLLDHKQELVSIMQQGQEKAKAVAAQKLDFIKNCIGLRY